MVYDRNKSPAGLIITRDMAEEAGVEPTRHVLHASPMLKTGPPTGEVSLP